MLTHRRSHANRRNSPLLRLPAELRNEIYAYAQDTITISRIYSYATCSLFNPGTGGYTLGTRASGTALSRVCFQTRHEAADLFTSATTLHIEARVQADKLHALLRYGALRDCTSLRFVDLSVTLAAAIVQDVRDLWTLGTARNWCDGSRSDLRPLLRDIRRVELVENRESELGNWTLGPRRRNETIVALRTIFTHKDMKVVFPRPYRGF